MTDEALLKAAELVLADAIAEAEFSRKPKDVAYVQEVAQKTEKLRAKIAGQPPMQITVTMVDGHLYTRYSYMNPLSEISAQS